MEGKTETTCGDPEELKELQKKQEIDAKKKQRNCSKCKVEKTKTFFRQDAVCWNCFDHLFVKRFKQNMTSIRKHRRNSDNLMFSFSGGPASSAMLHLIHRIKHELGDKHPFFNVAAVHIDESFLFLEEDESKAVREQMAAFAKKCEISLYIIPIETVFLLTHSSFNLRLSNGILDCDAKVLNSARKNLQDCLETTTSTTSKEDLLKFLREKLLGYLFHNIHLLHSENESTFTCVKMATAASASRLAVQLIADTCKGKGFSVAAQIAMEAPALQDVDVVRPMREFEGKEIASYNFYHKISPVFVPTFGTKGGAKFSINQLCEGFIEGLQGEFGHTIHTLLKSGSKLVVPQETSEAAKLFRCSLCSSYLSPSEVTQLNLTNKIEIQSPKAEQEGQCQSCNCNNKNETSCHEKKGLDSVKNQEFLPSSLCHGCRKLYQDLKVPSLLPAVVRQTSIQTKTTSTLRSQIQEYLL